MQPSAQSVWSEYIYQAFKDAGIGQVAYVPDAGMGLGSLATIGAEHPPNLSVVVVDNERYGETGMQLSHTAHGVDLAAIGTAANFASTTTIYTREALDAWLTILYAGTGPVLTVVKVLPNQPRYRRRCVTGRISRTASAKPCWAQRPPRRG